MNETLIVAIGMIIGAVIMSVIFSATSVSKDRVVAKGCAYYDSETVEFKWNDTEPSKSIRP